MSTGLFFPFFKVSGELLDETLLSPCWQEGSMVGHLRPPRALNTDLARGKHCYVLPDPKSISSLLGNIILYKNMSFFRK